MKDGQVKLDFRGGRREGSGRKPIGISKRVSITLPPDGWEWVDQQIEQGKAKSYSEFFRQLLGYL